MEEIVRVARALLSVLRNHTCSIFFILQPSPPPLRPLPPSHFVPTTSFNTPGSSRYGAHTLRRPSPSPAAFPVGSRSSACQVLPSRYSCQRLPSGAAPSVSTIT